MHRNASVYVVFLQLTKRGPPGTQNFPFFRVFFPVAMRARRFYTPYGVKGPNLLILTAREMLHIFGGR